MPHTNCYSRYYTIVFHEDFIEINIIKIPDNNYEKGKLYFDLSPYYQIENTVIKYQNKIFYNENELKKFFKFIKTYSSY